MNKERELLARVLESRTFMQGVALRREIEQLLAQPEQEPVYWENENTDFVLRLKAISDKRVVDIDHQMPIGYPLNDAEITTIKNKVMMMYGVDQDD